MLVAQHPTRCWDWCMPEDKKKKRKEKEPFLINEKQCKVGKW